MYLKLLPKLFALSAVLVFAFSGRPATAQSSNSRTLLWRISGKGLSAPSYLFGTMHLRDKRLFRLDDSVYRAIESTDGMAIELNPDELVAYYVNQAVDELQWEDEEEKTDKEDERLKDLVSEDDYDAFADELSKKLRKPAARITRRDLVRAKRRQLNEYLTKGEMSTFLDAYLYNIARRQGKWVGGIEDVMDQAGLMEESIDRSDIVSLTEDAAGARSVVEEMIRLYTAADLDGIERFVVSSGPREKMDALLLRRNVKMARRMDSLSQLRTMFFAVGAAHLPGDSGVIQLLRARGFSVDPVFSQHKTAADDYRYKEVPITWTTVRDTVGHYSIDMPGNPASFKLYGLIDTKFLLDIFNMAGYCTMSVYTVDRQRSPAKLMDDMATKMFGGRAAPSFKAILQDGVAGREYTQIARGYPTRVRLFVHGRMVYMAMAYGFRKSALTSPDATRYFSSMKIDKSAQVSSTTANRFTDSVMAVSLESGAMLAPVKMTLDEETAASYDVRTWTGVDVGAEAYVMLNVQAVREGYHIINDSAGLRDNVEMVRGQYLRLTDEPYEMAGHQTVMLRGARDGANVRGLMLMRGNRRYLMMVIGDSANLEKPAVDAVLGSFRLLPYRAAVTSPQQDSTGTFSTTSPSPIKALVTQELFSTTSNYSAYDSNSSTTYTVSVDTLGQYAWYESDSAAWASRLAAYYTEATDTITSERRWQKSGADDAREWRLRKRGGATINRILVMRHGRIMYTVFAAGDSEAIDGKTANDFFKNFRPLTTAEPFDWLKSRRDDLLMNGLGSADSATRLEAANALRTAQFSKNDLPALHAAFLRSYPAPYSPSDTSGYVNGIIGEHIADLADSSSLLFLSSRYPVLAGPDAYKRQAVLLTLAKMRTPASFQTLASLLPQATSAEEAGFELRYELADSLRLLHAIYPQLLSLVSDTAVGYTAASLLRVLRDSGFVTAADLQAAESHFVTLSAHAVRSLRADSAAEYFTDDLIALLGSFGTQASRDALKEYFALKGADYYRMLAAVEMLRAGGAADAAVLRSSAANPSLRLSLYRALVGMGRTEAFPKEFRSQRQFAEALAQEAAEYDDYEVSRIVPIGTRTATGANGKPQRFYLFKVFLAEDGDEGKPWLAIAGGFPHDTGRLLPEDESDVTGVYWEEPYTASSEDAAFAAFMREASTRAARD